METPTGISVFTPLQAAWDHTRRMLFEPFDFKKWLFIGFTCFLANLSSYSSNGGNYSGGNTSSSSESPQGLLSSMEELFGEFAAVALGLGIVVLVMLVVLVLALVIAMVWVSCRGTFMFLDNVARNRADIAAPWKSYARQGWHLFYLYLGAFAAFFGMLFGGGLIIGILAGMDLVSFESFSSLTLIALICLLAAVVIAFLLFTFLIKSIVIPRMYIQKCGAIEALRDSWSLFCHYPLEWISFLLVSLGLALASIFLVITFCLFTCCIAVLPYINQVLMLPMYVFIQAYGLYFLAQFGPKWDAFPPAPPALSTSHAT